MKTCRKCNRTLSDESFKKTKQGLYYICKECERAYMIEYRARNRERINKQHSEYMKTYKEDHRDEMNEYARNYARKKLKIDPEKYRGKQNGKFKKDCGGDQKLYNILHRYGLTKEEYNKMPKYCEVCGSKEKLHIDHDHKTGKVRGTLCQRCNIALGLLRDNPVYIENLKIYLMNSLTES